MSIFNNNINETTIYEKTFNQETGALWIGTKFENEIAELSYYRALSCWLRNNDEGERDRRRLFYNYLSDVFSTSDPEDTLNKMFPTLPSDNTYVTRALRNLCTLYNEPPARYYNNLDDKKVETLNYYLEQASYNKRMQEAYRICKLMNKALIRPYKINGMLSLKIYTPDLYRVAYDDYYNITEVWIPRQEKYLDNNKYKIRTIYDVWDSQRYRKLDYHGNPVVFIYNNQKYTELPLPAYKCPPFCELIIDGDSDVYGGGLWELAKAQLEANMWDFLIKENAIYNGFSVWMMVNFGKKYTRAKLSPGHVIKIDNVKEVEGDDIPPYIDTITPSQQYTEMNEIKTTRIKMMLKNIGLPSSIVEDRDTSGVAMLIDRAELNEMRMEDISVLKHNEKRLHNVIANVLNTEFDESYPDEIDVTMDYVEPSVYREPKDEYEYHKSLYDNGFIDVKTFIHKITGDDSIITEQDATEYINNNLRIVNELRRTAGAGGSNESAISTVSGAEDNQDGATIAE